MRTRLLPSLIIALATVGAWAAFAPDYTPTTSFAEEEANAVSGRSTVRTAAIDTEFAAIQTSIGALNDNLQAIQRSDDELKDGVVKPHTLSTDTLELIGSTDWTLKGAWLTSTAYAVRDVVTQSDNTYICAEAHTAGTFATDLAAGKWILLAEAASGITASSVTSSATGDIASTNVQAALAELDSEKVPKAGGTMTGLLTLSGAPSSNLHAATKKYVDDADALLLPLAGGTMTGGLVLSGEPSAALHAVPMRDLVSQIGGLVLANNGSDANNDIDIAAGAAADSTNAYMLRLSSTMTKRMDASWAAGTNQGGMFTGSESASTWYHVCLIRADADGSIDAGFDTSTTCANKPAGYTAYRLIGSVYNDGSSNLKAFYATETAGGGVKVLWTTPPLDVNLTNTLTTAARTDTLTVPTGYVVEARINAFLFDAGSSVQAYISSPNASDQAPAQTASPLATLNAAAGDVVFMPMTVLTNTSAQIRARGNIATADNYRVATLGWEWARR